MRYLILLLFISACNPIVGATSFMHSLMTGNTVGTITGGAGIAIQGETGKSVTEHVMDMVKPKPRPPELEWIFEEK